MMKRAPLDSGDPELAANVGLGGDDDEEEIDSAGKVLLSLANILPNRQVCFANQKLHRTVPVQQEHAEHFVDIINTFIKFMNHKYRGSSVLFRYV